MGVEVMGLLGTVVADEGVLRLADALLSTVGMVVALWLAVRWNPGVSRE